MLTAIRNWVIRTMMKAKGETGIVKTLPKKEIVDINTQITAQRLMENGINPESLKNADQVENAIIAIENRKNVQTGFTTKKSADVFDLEGKKINPDKGIMGGKQFDDLPPGDDDLPPPGSRGGDDDIAAPFQSREETMKNMIEDELMKSENPFSDLVKTTKKGPKTIKEREAEILASMEKSNKETVQRIRNRKMVKDAIDNVSPGFVKGDRKYNAQLVAEDLAQKKFNKEFYDLDQKQQIDLYGEALDGLDDSDKFAQGGRAGFKAGLGKRFLDLLKGKPKLKFDERRFREGPIDLKFLENIDKKDLEKFIKTRDTKGPGSYGMYDDFADMPAGLRAAELIKTIKTKDGAINYKAAELFLGKKLKGDESVDELIQMLNRKEMRAQGGRAGFKDGLTPSFEEYMRERKGIEQKRNLEQMYKEYLEDMRRKKVMEQKQMVAEGGRIGFKDGMTRRTFLKIFGGLVSLPIIGKIVKPLKLTTGVKKVPIIKTDNVPGKPEWFDQLVNKVIVEGDDVTKKFATGERQSIHQKTLDDGSVIRVTEDVDDGAVRVEYESEQNVFGDPVQMEYKKPLPDESVPNPKAKFTTAESGPVGRARGPDDYEIEVDEVGGTSIRDLDSDVSKLKEYATGQKPTMKELVQNIERRKKAQRITDDPEAQSDAVIRRQGEADDSYYGDPEEFASGAIACLLGE